jgi:hypothetical protein
MGRVKKEETFVKLSRKMLSGARVIAKGERIRDVQRLVAQYGGRVSQWVKKSTHSSKPPGRILSIIGMSITGLAGSRQSECE